MNINKETLKSPKKIVPIVLGLVLILSAAGIAIASAASGSTPAGISKEEAIRIAMKDAGCTEDNATLVLAEKDKDYDEYLYDIEFNYNGYEYDYEIDYVTGKILEVDKDRLPGYKDKTENKNNDADNQDSDAITGATTDENQGSENDNNDSNSNSQSTSEKIGLSKAKSIALGRAGLSASSVTFEKATLDRDDGRWVYEIEFYTSTKEYEFEIDAKSGKILDYGLERIDHDDDDYDDDDDDDEYDD